MDYQNICYQNPFLNQVIVRLDFMETLQNAKVFYEEFERSIVKYFPKKGKDQLIKLNEINVMINVKEPSESAASSELVVGLQKEYWDKNMTNKFIVSNRFIVFEINAYSSFEKMFEMINSIVPSFMAMTNVTVQRMGIRYINIFDPEKIKIRKNYFQSDVASSLSKKTQELDDDLKIIRTMHLAEYNFQNMHLNFRYGMFNPEYPNPLKKDNFVLDYDCFIQEAISSSAEIMQGIANGHKIIQKMFENSITDGLRKVMKNE